jgi:hypothetical protein
MNAREEARFDAVKRVGTFGTNNASDFTTPVPPAAAVTPGQVKAKALFDSLNTPVTGLIALLAKNAQTQQTGTGTAHGGTTAKEVLLDALFLELKGLNRTAAAIATAQSKPEIMDHFRMPYGVSHPALAAKARAIADAAAPLTADFIDHGHEPTFVADLKAHIKAFEDAEGTQSTGMQTQAGATEGFNPLLREAMIALKQLNAFAYNFYKTNPAKLGEWRTAVHVERQPKAKKPATPPNKPNP